MAVREKISLYAAALVLVALSLGAFLAHTGVGNPFAVIGLALIAAVAERGRVRLAPSVETSISLIPTLFAAVVFGPFAAMIVSGASLAGEFNNRAFPPRDRILRWLIYTSSRSITGAISGFVALAIQQSVSSRGAAIAIATASAAVTGEILDGAFAAATLKLRGGRASSVISTLIPVAPAALALYVPVVAVLALAYLELSPWTLALFFIPALAAQRTFALYQEQRRLAEDLTGANARLERANLSFATALVATLDARDRYTAGHSAAVSIYSRDIAMRMGLSEEQQKLVHLAGLVHDIGKVGLPPGLLEKEGPLTLEERRQMESHPAIAEGILEKVEDYAEIASVVRHHHERVDGQGYPDALRHDDIPLLARIIAVADAYNAMTSDRPYREAMPSRVARLRLAQAVESQFDTSVVAAFEAILAGADEDYRLAASPDFSLSVQDPFAIESFASERPALLALG
jgi:HD-GYP domain-containing protein (c-di-GMP phosphodiesterase class II)